MSDTSLELRQKKDRLVTQADEINRRCEVEHRDLTDAEQAEFRSLLDEANDLGPQIERAERSELLNEVKAELRSVDRRVRPVPYAKVDRETRDLNVTDRQESNGVRLLGSAVTSWG